VRTTVIRTTAVAALLSAAALTLIGCSTSLQGPANPNDTQTTSYGPAITTETQPSLTVAPTSGSPSTGGDTSGNATSGSNTAPPSDTGAPQSSSVNS
jgi:hypothetical protein